MADKPTTTNIYNVDQAVSVNGYLDVSIAENETANLLISVRNGASVDDVVRVTMNAVEAMSKLRATYPRPEAKSEPVRIPVDDSGNEVKTFTAKELVVDMHEGKVFTKVKGGHFEKYGVPVWPEVLEKADISVKMGEAVPDIQGWTATYVEWETDEGKKRMKVVSLTPPQ